MVGVVVLSIYIVVLLLGVFCQHGADMPGFVRNDTTLTRHLRSQKGPMSPTWSVLCRQHVANMSLCLSFWRKKIPDMTPTLPAKDKRTMVFMGRQQFFHSPTPWPTWCNQTFPSYLQYLLRSTPSKKSWIHTKTMNSYHPTEWPKRKKWYLLVCPFLYYHFQSILSFHLWCDSTALSYRT